MPVTPIDIKFGLAFLKFYWFPINFFDYTTFYKTFYTFSVASNATKWFIFGKNYPLKDFPRDFSTNLKDLSQSSFKKTTINIPKFTDFSC